MYALFERIDDEQHPWKRKVLITRFQVPGNVDVNQTTYHRTVASNLSKNDGDDDYDDFETDVKEYSPHRDYLQFVFLDVKNPIHRDLIGPFRAIHDNVKLYSKPTSCLKFLRYSNDKIFLITTSTDKDLVKEIQDCSSVEAIFIFNSQADFDRTRLPKLIGMYKHSEELIAALKNTFEWFEQSQFDFFTFEREQLFLYLQFWREFILPIHPRISSTKQRLVEFAEKYYRGNLKLLKSLDDFDYCYERNEVLQWCILSTFPSQFLRQALYARHQEHIDLCRFLLSDVSRFLHQNSDQKSNREIFKGLKISNEDLENLLRNTGKLICSKGFLVCYKSRTAALDIARGSDYRPDLRPVLFKISCPPTTPMGEIPTVGLFVFDVYMTFRIKCVNRGRVSIVKLEPADEDGRNSARSFRSKSPKATVDQLLDHLAEMPKPPTPQRSPSRPRPSSPPAPSLPLVKQKPKTEKKISPPTLPKEELRAQKCVQQGEIDQALHAYQNLKTQSPRVLNTVADLYADKKGDYTAAIKYYRKAMEIQEKHDEDISETLTQLGIAHHNRREFDQALSYHNRALEIRQKKTGVNRPDIASNLIGIANAKWGQDQLPEAFQNAQKALQINESIPTGNEVNLAMNLAILANIHHRAGDDTKALDYITRALAILESSIEPDSLTLASVLNNMGTIQISLEIYKEAKRSFNRALKICEKNLPKGHPKRVTIEANIQLVKDIMESNEQ